MIFIDMDHQILIVVFEGIFLKISRSLITKKGKSKPIFELLPSHIPLSFDLALVIIYF